MLRRVLVLAMIVGFSILASSWMYIGLEAGEGTPENIMLKKVFAIAGLGVLIVGAVVSISRFDDDAKRP